MKTRYISIFLTPLLLFLSTGCENEKDVELLKLDNVVLTPHSAAYTEECLAEMSMHCAKNINDFFNNKMNKSLLVNKDIYT